MRAAVIYDCEFLAVEGSPRRFWCGPQDPDPSVVQVGAVRLDLEPPFSIAETLRRYVRPVDRAGRPVAIDPHLARLTGITNDVVRAEGVPLAEALGAFEAFAGGATCWSWGRDDINLMAISCYVEGIAPPMPATRFGNLCVPFIDTVMTDEEMRSTRSNELPAHFGVDVPELRAHDALDDALALAHVVRHLLAEGRLDPGVLRLPEGS